MTHKQQQVVYGFTLIEVVMSMAIASVIMLAMTSAMMMAGHAVPDVGSTSMQIADTGSTAGQMLDELRYALHFSERTATAVTFTIPDRDNDGDPERIRYHWSGTAGDPLYRNYNGAANSLAIDSLESFALTYELEAVTETYPGPEVPSSEGLISSHDSGLELNNYKIDKNKWIGQTFRPTFPSDTTRWEVTRLFVTMVSEGTPNEQLAVRLEKVDDAGFPTGEIVGQDLLDETNFNDSVYAWYEVTFADGVESVSLGERLVIVLANLANGGSPGRTLYSTLGSAGIGYVKSSDKGSSWNEVVDRTLNHYIYGRYWTPGTDQTLTRNEVTRVIVAMQPTSDAATVSKTACELINRPMDVPSVWRLTFDETSPTTTDYDGDGVGDWVVRLGTVLNPANISGGVWTSDSTLDSAVLNDFTTPTTIDARLRNTSVGGKGAVVWINADWNGTAAAPIYASVTLQLDGTQTVGFYNKTDASTHTLLAEVEDLEEDFVDVRLIIDPSADTVATFVNGVHRGTFNYTSFIVGHSNQFVSLLGWGSTAQFDAVCVRVGGTGGTP